VYIDGKLSVCTIFLFGGTEMDWSILLLIIGVCLCGTIVGKAIRKEMQENYCPHCACAENCNIGYNVEQADGEKEPMACYKK
jgi:hypothetical protein